MAYQYPAMVAWDPGSKAVVKNSVFYAYAPGDTSFSLPLPITDPYGNLIQNLNSGAQGVFPAFAQAQYTTVVLSDSPNHAYAWTVPAALTTAVMAWAPSTYYTQGQPVVNPSGDTVTAKVNHTSGSSYTSANWNYSVTFATPAQVATNLSTSLNRTNLDTNPSFETGTTGWQANGTGTTIGISTAQAYVGTQSMLITWGTTYGNATQTLTTAIGVTYTWSMWVFVPANGTPIQLTAYGSVPAQVYSTASTITGAWQRLSVTFTTNGTSVTLGVQGSIQPSSGQTCYVDGSLIEATAGVYDWFSGDTAATGAARYSWLGTANASASIQAIGGQAWASAGSLPGAYTSANAIGVYDQRLNVFNWKQSNTRRLRAALARAKSGSGAAKIGFAGDSTTAGYQATASTQSVPVVVRDLLSASGYPIMGTGPVVGNPGGGPGGFLDSRWAFTGTWTTQSNNNNFLYQTVVNGATATFTSDKPGTVVELRYMNNGGAFTYAIDGGAATAVTPTGAGTLASVTVTGLANTTHTLVITTTSTSPFYLLWADVRGSTGFRVANFGVCSSTTGDWVNSNFYFPGNMMADWAPDVTFLNLGINDVGGSVATSTVKTNLQTLITQFKASGDVIMVTSNPHQSLNFTALNQAKYQLAVSNDIPLIDLYDRFTSYAVSNPLGLYADAAHPNGTGYADLGRCVFQAIA